MGEGGAGWRWEEGWGDEGAKNMQCVLSKERRILMWFTLVKIIVGPREKTFPMLSPDFICVHGGWTWCAKKGGGTKRCV